VTETYDTTDTIWGNKRDILVKTLINKVFEEEKQRHKKEGEKNSKTSAYTKT
jgi:hypothetical protein